MSPELEAFLKSVGIDADVVTIQFIRHEFNGEMTDEEITIRVLY